MEHISFRPHIGDYFFITTYKTSRKNLESNQLFPSPYWGLFFYQEELQEIKSSINELGFPSSYWGLFFYLRPRK